MPPTTPFARAAARPLFRQAHFASQARSAFRRPMGQRRFQSTAAEDAGAGGAGTGPQQQAHRTWYRRMWESPIGVKTVHFWAPVMKWAIVIAGISDLGRPAEKLSWTQNGALTATGLIWTRWCLIIKPKNYLLAAVNFFLGIVGIVQCSRIVMYERSKKSLTDVAKDVTQDVKDATQDVKDAVKS